MKRFSFQLIVLASMTISTVAQAEEHDHNSLPRVPHPIHRYFQRTSPHRVVRKAPRKPIVAKKISVQDELMQLLTGHHVQPKESMERLRNAPQTLPFLTQMATDPKQPFLVRSRAMSLLRYLPAAKATPVILAVFNHSQSSDLLQSDALRHLVKLSPEKAQNYLYKALQSPHYLLRAAAIRGIQRLSVAPDIQRIQHQLSLETSASLRKKLQQLLSSRP